MITLAELTVGQWGALAAAAVFLGLHKTGLQGLVMLVIPILATTFGGRASAGLLLPMLSVADISALYYYHSSVSWKHIFRVLPTTVAGVALGTIVGASIPDQAFVRIIGGVIIVSLVVLVYNEYIRRAVTIPRWWWFPSVIGLTGGVASMIGNSSSVIMALYLLSMRLPKEHYIGTGAWFFFLINLIKIPFHIFAWGTITLNTLAVNAIVAPLILVGAIAGVHIVRRIPEKPYRIFVLVVTFFTAVRLFL